MPHLKTKSENKGGADKTWLLNMPVMKGEFALFNSPSPTNRVKSFNKAALFEVSPCLIEEVSTDVDIDTAAIIHQTHEKQLYCPQTRPPSASTDTINESNLSPYSSRHSTSLFWDELLEELRFFYGDHQVPMLT